MNSSINAIDIYRLNDFATDKLIADLTLILDISAETAIKRIQENDREQNYIDKKSLDFHMRIDEEYRDYFGVDIKHVNANRDLSDVANDVLKYVEYYISKSKNIIKRIDNDTESTGLASAT